MTNPITFTIPSKQAAAPNFGWWMSLVDTWDLLGLDAEVIDPVRATHARHEATTAERKVAHEEALTTQARIRGDVARGVTTFDKAAKEWAVSKALEELADPTIGRRYTLVLLSDLTATMRKVGDRLIVEHLAPAYEAVVAAATPLLPIVAQVADEKEAMRASTEIRDAWADLMRLKARGQELHGVAKILRHAHITTVSREDAFDAEYEYRHPDRVTRLGIASIADGAEPYIGTAAQVDALEASRPEPLRNPKKPTPIVRRDSSLVGSVTQPVA